MRRHGGRPERDFALPLIPTTEDQPAAPPCQPPTNLRHHSHEGTTVVSPPQTLRGRPNQTRPPPIGTRSTTTTWEGTTSTGTSRSRPDAGAGARRTPCPAGPRTGPLSSCSGVAADAARSRRSQRPHPDSPAEGDPPEARPARPDPDRTQKGPDLGLQGSAGRPTPSATTAAKEQRRRRICARSTSEHRPPRCTIAGNRRPSRGAARGRGRGPPPPASPRRCAGNARPR